MQTAPNQVARMFTEGSYTVTSIEREADTILTNPHFPR